VAKRDNLGVVEPVVLVPAFSGQCASRIQNYATDYGIGRAQCDAVVRELQRPSHPAQVGFQMPSGFRIGEVIGQGTS
jgi:hypothetical protein